MRYEDGGMKIYPDGPDLSSIKSTKTCLICGKTFSLTTAAHFIDRENRE